MKEVGLSLVRRSCKGSSAGTGEGAAMALGSLAIVGVIGGAFVGHWIQAKRALAPAVSVAPAVSKTSLGLSIGGAF